jgi:hypothetical protein
VYRLFSSSLCSLLVSPLTSSLLTSNILVSTLFSDTLSLHPSLNVSDQASQPYKKTGRIIFLYILIIKIFYHTGRPNVLHWMIASIPWLQSAMNFFLNIL